MAVFSPQRRPAPSPPVPGLRCLASGTRSAAVDVDHWQIVGRGLKDVAIVMDLHELAPVGGRATSGRQRWRLERFAKMREDFPDRPRIAGEEERREPPWTWLPRRCGLSSRAGLQCS